MSVRSTLTRAAAGALLVNAVPHGVAGLLRGHDGSARELTVVVASGAATAVALVAYFGRLDLEL